MIRNFIVMLRLPFQQCVRSGANPQAYIGTSSMTIAADWELVGCTEP